jgi:hypothetical protein
MQGAAREIHGGSGWYSQDSPVHVLSLTEGADELTVRWPGGRQTRHPLPPGRRFLEVEAPVQ